MALPLSGPEIAKANELDPGLPYLWFLEIFVPSAAPGEMVRYVSNPVDRDFGQDSQGDPVTYNAGNFQVGRIRRDAEGIFPVVTVVASNVSRILQAALEDHGGLVDSDARVFLVNAALIGTGKATWDLSGKVVRSRSKGTDATIEIGLPNLVQRNFPAERVTRDFCRLRYGGSGCGYDAGRGGALQACDKTKDGANGCQVHGDDEVAASLPRQHPKRFGGFPGMKRRGGVR